MSIKECVRNNFDNLFTTTSYPSPSKGREIPSLARRVGEVDEIISCLFLKRIYPLGSSYKPVKIFKQ
jgi:hypothetical protein